MSNYYGTAKSLEYSSCHEACLHGFIYKELTDFVCIGFKLAQMTNFCMGSGFAERICRSIVVVIEREKCPSFSKNLFNQRSLHQTWFTGRHNFNTVDKTCTYWVVWCVNSCCFNFLLLWQREKSLCHIYDRICVQSRTVQTISKWLTVMFVLYRQIWSKTSNT